MNRVSGLDKLKIRRSFAAAAQGYDHSAGLQRTAGCALLGQFPPDDREGTILDIGCGTGFLTRKLAAQTDQHVIALDIALPMLLAARQKTAGIGLSSICADAEAMPFAMGSIRQIYSNLALQWCQNLPSLFADCRWILKAGGKLVFTTFGAATLGELKTSWAAVDGFTHVNDFYGCEQIEEFLWESGFNSIKATSIHHRMIYPSVLALMRELQALGARNANLARNRKNTTRRQLQRMIEHYENSMDGGPLYATYEIIYAMGRT